MVLAISLTVLASTTYVSYYTVASADFLSSNLGFEAFDQEYLSAAQQSEVKVVLSVGSFNGFFLSTHLFGLASHISSQTSFLSQKSLVLRC